MSKSLEELNMIIECPIEQLEFLKDNELIAKVIKLPAEEVERLRKERQKKLN